MGGGRPGRRFDDLFNLVHDPATLTMAYVRVAGNSGANTPGVDGLTAAAIEEDTEVPGPEDLRAQLKTDSFRPLPVRARLLRVPADAAGARRRRRDPAFRQQGIPLGAVLDADSEAGFDTISTRP